MEPAQSFVTLALPSDNNVPQRRPPREALSRFGRRKGESDGSTTHEAQLIAADADQRAGPPSRGGSWRPRRSSVSPLTDTCPPAISAFASAPPPAAPASLSSWP